MALVENINVLGKAEGFKYVGHAADIIELVGISNVQDGDRVLLAEYNSGTGLGGGVFQFRTSTTAPNDGGYCIAVNGGFWLRIQSTEVKLSDYGLTGAPGDFSIYVAHAARAASRLGLKLNLDVNWYGQSIVLDGIPNLYIYGVGVGKLLDGVNKVLLTFRNCSNLHINGIELDGNRFQQTSTSQTETPDGVGTLRIEQCSNWKVENCDIHDNRLGAALLIIDNGTNQSTNWQGSIQNGYLHKNYIHDNGVAGVVMSDGVFSWSHSTTLSDNVIRRCTDYGIALDYSERTIVRGNIISDVFIGFGVLGVDDLLVDGNNIDGAEVGIAVTTSGNPMQNPYISRNVTLIGNKLKNIVEVTALGDGIYVDPSCENILIQGNTVQNAKRGIACAAENAVVTGNFVLDARERSYQFEARQGNFTGNSEVSSSGTYPSPSYFSGPANRTGTEAGVQHSTVQVQLEGQIIPICRFTSRGEYSAGAVTATFAGLINSVGPVFVQKQFLIKRAGAGAYTVTEIGTAGDVTTLSLTADASSGEPVLYARLLAGSSTMTTVQVQCLSSGIGDSVLGIQSMG